MENVRSTSDLGKAPIYWMHEAISYLGLDRLGLTRPDKAIYRLVEKGALHPKKIAGHFAFDKKELDMIYWLQMGPEARQGKAKNISIWIKENTVNSRIKIYIRRKQLNFHLYTNLQDSTKMDLLRCC